MSETDSRRDLRALVFRSPRRRIERPRPSLGRAETGTAENGREAMKGRARPKARVAGEEISGHHALRPLMTASQNERVGIARTLLKNPPILLLDEATSALDSETEHEIQDALDRAGRGRTVLMIAHRLSTVAKADSIIVLEEGKVVERGDHETLLARKGRYHALWTLQQSEKSTAA